MNIAKRKTDSISNNIDEYNNQYNNDKDKDNKMNILNSDYENCRYFKGDLSNIAILFFLYMLQGIPLGLTAAVPMLLQNRGASYKQQAEFSFSFWPFNLKLFWAPIVDSLYWKQIGKRKSWLIPVQYLIGLFMIFLSLNINDWLGGQGEIENLKGLTLMFFILNFLAATQDIAVDGWALTMLKRCNVGYASTCNSVGQTAGYFCGYVLFIALESKEFCNNYIRSEPKDEGIVTLSQFLWFWGTCFLITTTLIAVLKSESNRKYDSFKVKEELELNIKESYMVLLKIIKLRPVQVLAVILLTVKITFSACDTVASLKLIDAGVPKEKLALLVIPIIPLQIILPLVISKYTSGPRPMDIYLKAIPYRIGISLISVFLVYITPYLISFNNGEIPTYFYVILVLNYGLYQIFLNCMFVAIMAFFAKISDPVVGGTYMTLLNTLTNMGTNWPNTIILWLVDILTWRECIHSGTDTEFIIDENNKCLNKLEQEECTNAGGKCLTNIDGFYVETIFCLVYGVIWIFLFKRQVQRLQRLPMEMWHVATT